MFKPTRQSFTQKHQHTEALWTKRSKHKIDIYDTLLNPNYIGLRLIINLHSCVKKKYLRHCLVYLAYNLFFSPNQKLWISISWRPLYGNITVDIQILRGLSKSRLYAKMLRLFLFSIFTIKTPRALAALASLSLLIVTTLQTTVLSL